MPSAQKTTENLNIYIQKNWLSLRRKSLGIYQPKGMAAETTTIIAMKKKNKLESWENFLYMAKFEAELS